MIRTGLLATAVLVASTAVAGCSGDADEPSDDPQAGSSSTTTPDAPTTLTGAVPALKDLRVDACASGEGTLTAAGGVRNRSVKQPVDYLVTVTWLDEAGAVLATAQTTVEDVKRRTTREWSVEGDLEQPASSCTTAVSRAPARLPG